MNSFASILFAFLHLAVWAASDEPKVVYYVYYSDDQCESKTAGVVAKVAGENFLGVGGRSPDGKCSEEVVCMLDADSSLCQSLERTNSGNGHVDVDEYGVVVECDTSNTDEPECSAVPNECFPSSIYPNCHFRLKTEEQLEANPTIIGTGNSDVVDTHAYMIFFSDEQCETLEAIKGVASDSVLTSVDETVSCIDAVTCALGPDGNSCSEISEDKKGTVALDVKTTESGILICLDDGSCEFAPEGCAKSDILQSCYFKWVEPTTLFNDPEDTVFADPPLQLEKPEDETEKKPSSGTLIQSIASAIAGAAALVVI